MSEYSFIQNGFIIHKPLINPGNRETTTINLSNGLFTGLHIDYWDKLELSAIEDARNRISFNLGRSSRYLLFINLTVRTLIQLIEDKKQIDYENYNQNNVVFDFLSLYPDYPVLKLEIKPFEGYIAPTENMIHDGSTLNIPTKDIQVFSQGYFNLAPLPSSLQYPL